MHKMAKTLLNALITTALVSASCATKPQLVKIYVTKCHCAEPMAEKPMKTVGKKAATENAKNMKVDFGKEPWYMDFGIEKEPAVVVADDKKAKSWYSDGGFDSVNCGPSRGPWL